MIILLGIAGSGKTTQAKILAEKLECPWLSTGQLLRDNMNDPVALQKMQEGEVINDDLLLPLLDSQLKILKADSQELVLDGSPRTLRQAQWMADKIKAGEIKLTAVVHIKVSEAIAKARLLSRRRKDDHPVAIAERFTEYEQAIKPILDFFKSQGYKVLEVDGEGTVEQDTLLIEQALEI